MNSRYLKRVSMALCVLAASTILSAHAEPPWKVRVKCAEGIGCSDSDDPPVSDGESSGKGSAGKDSPGLGDGMTGNVTLPGGYENVPCGADRRAQSEQQKHDAQRRNKRKRHHAEYEASMCPRPEVDPAEFGGFHNDCLHDVEVSFCVLHPEPESWAAAFDCEHQSFGTLTISARGKTAAQIRGGDEVKFGACESPESSPLDAEYDPATGDVRFRCNKWGDYSSEPDANSGAPQSPAHTDANKCTHKEEQLLTRELQQIKEDKKRELEMNRRVADAEQTRRNVDRLNSQNRQNNSPAVRSPNPVPVSPPANPPSPAWPPGIEPGNLYILEAYNDEGKHVPRIEAARTAEQAIADSSGRYMPSAKHRVIAECKGPNWGAVVFEHVIRPYNFDDQAGAACGHRTPAAAIRAAAADCAQRVGHTCLYDGYALAWVRYAGASSSSAFSGSIDSIAPTKHTARSIEEAIAQIGQVCAIRNYSGSGSILQPCWMTSRNRDCIFKDEWGDTSQCVDRTFTAEGFR